MVNIKSSWNKIANLYNKRYLIETDTVHYGPLCPGENVLQLIGDISGKSAIDLGCGGGQNCIALNRAGAKTTGVDFSAEQLNQAKLLAETEKAKIDFVAGDLTSLPLADNNNYDLAISACAMAFVKDLRTAFKEVFRILKPGGKFIVSVMHPMQYIIDGDKDTMFFNSAYPFNSRLLRWTWDFDDRSIPFQHYLRSISEYHNSLVQTGFVIKEILEPKPTLRTPHKSFSREIMIQYRYIAEHLPITLILAAVKPEAINRKI
jgi:ubiquinone/menaquinone biosynthesis C-methylase UbiE